MLSWRFKEGVVKIGQFLMKIIIVAGIAVLAILTVAFIWPRTASTVFRAFERLMGCLGRRRALAVLVVGMLSIAINAFVTHWAGEAPPHIHDEFANLLAADTFLHGRLANPSPKDWEFFESIHVLVTPVYASKYPPMQGIMLAIGQGLTGHPVVGMWLSVALACAAICWALFAWLPPRWAVLGGLLAVFHPMLLKWGQVYWGGAEAMLGGALVAGAVRYLVKRRQAGYAVALAVGMVILALSRPFEGLVLSLILVGFLLIWLLGNREMLGQAELIQMAVPAAVVLGLWIGWQGYYNMRLTGNPAKLPYMVYEEQYAVAPFFIWQKPRPEPQYRHEYIKRHFVDYAMKEYLAQQSIGGFLKQTAVKIRRLGRDFLGRFYVLLVPLLALPWVVRRRGWPRVGLVAIVIFGLALAQETWMWDRYAAPIGALFFLLVAWGFRHWSLWRCCGKPLGRIVVLLVVAGFLAQSALWIKVRKAELAKKDWEWQRAEIIKKLSSDGRQHLVFVRYPKVQADPSEPSGQSVHNDWVHNGADLISAPVLWVRDMGAEANRKLIQNYQGRVLWLLEAENRYDPPPNEIKPAVLRPYPDGR